MFSLIQGWFCTIQSVSMKDLCNNIGFIIFRQTCSSIKINFVDCRPTKHNTNLQLMCKWILIGNLIEKPLPRSSLVESPRTVNTSRTKTSSLVTHTHTHTHTHTQFLCVYSLQSTCQSRTSPQSRTICSRCIIIAPQLLKCFWRHVFEENPLEHNLQLYW